MERLKRPRLRKREGLVLAEGPRVVTEALRSDVAVRGLWIEEAVEHTRQGGSVLAAAAEKGVEVTVVEDGGLGAVSDTESHQAMIAIAEEPPPCPVDRHHRGPVLLLDGLQDPGNVGTLIRTAWALGLAQVWTTRGCSDPWGSKAVRASAGAVFHLEIVGVDEGLEVLAGGERRVWVAEAAGTPVTRVPGLSDTDWVLAVGNEGGGVSEAVRALGSGVSIPMSGWADSLNVAVAGSILMYVLVQAGRDGDV